MKWVLRVVLAAGLLLTPAFASGQQPPPSTKPAPKKLPPKPPPKLKVGAFELSKKSAASTSATAGASRGLEAQAVVPLAPQLGKSYSVAPRLFWRKPPFISRVTVRLYDAEMNRWEWEVEGTQFQIPAGEVALQAGAHYQWQVLSSLGHLSAMHEIDVVGEAERGEIEQGLAALASADTLEGGLARARLFAEQGLWYDAVDAYTSLIEQYSDRADLYDERGQVLAALAVTKQESEQDERKAHELAVAAPQ
ncbi:MAG: DUF928 domain-containing protein [Candidatus Acidiferrales bacterium]